MQQLNIKTVPVNLAAAIQIVSQAIRRRKERDESTIAAALGEKPQPAMEAAHRQSSSRKYTQAPINLTSFP